MITASLVLYNSKEDELRKVVGCVHNSNIEILFVIDNSSTDLLREKVTALSRKVVYIFGQGNVGYGKAHNIGIKKAIALKADYHVVLNPDVFFDSDVVPSIEDFMNKHMDVGLVLPNVVYPNGNLQYLCKLLPTPLDIFGRRLLSEKYINKRNDRYEMREMGYNKIWNCPILSGCFMFLRISDIIKVGMFDERFFMYFEDFDLMRRLHKICKTVFYPKVTIVHNHAAEHHSNNTLLRASIKSAIQYFNKWGWFFDRERRKENKFAFDEINHLSE